MWKKILGILLIAVIALGCCGCEETKSSGTAALKFKDAISFDTIKSLDGKKVQIVGYMATLSPIRGNYIYLMNMPYQSCPFCVPNTTQLANTMAVYAPSGKVFTYTDQAVLISGVMEVGNFTDDFGYEYNYRIRDATASTVDLGQISEQYKLWQSIASDGIVADINSMLDFVHFTCCWCEYSVNYIDDDGNEVFYYLYAGDVDNYLEDESIYGYASFMKETYFPSLVSRVRAISPTELEDLVGIITDAEKLKDRALAELNAGHYSYDPETDRFSIDAEEEMYNTYMEIYMRFSNWLAGWEL